MHAWVKRAALVSGRESLGKECMVLHGPCGSGKSHLARLFLQTYNYTIVEFNYLDHKSIKTAISQVTPVDSTRRRVAVLVDELYELWEDVPGLLDVKCLVPTICNTNRKVTKVALAHSAFLRSLDRASSVTIVTETLKKLPAAQRITSSKTVDSIVEMSMGDGRQLINNTILAATARGARLHR